MKRVCAWCRVELGGKDGDDADAITHGVCNSCISSASTGTGMQLQRFLDTLDVPVLAVDSDLVVKVPNGKANVLLQKDRAGLAGKRGGEVFECAYARLPGGCGKTVHCSGCTIRILVNDTFRTGLPRLRVPAYLCHGAPGAESEIGMHVSTEKVGDLVLLRIDRVGKRGPDQQAVRP